MLKTKEETKVWLDMYGVKNYTINEDLTVEVSGDVYLSNCNLEYLPVKFSVVLGSFNCNSNKLTSLEGCPGVVGKSFFALITF